MIPSDIKDKQVIVTGANGFFGSHIVRLLENLQAIPIALSSADWDMVSNAEPPTHIARQFKYADLVLHLAGFNGGIKYNMDYPADIFEANTLMGLHLLRTCQIHEVPKVVSVVTSCAYPELQLEWSGSFEQGGLCPYQEYRSIPRELCQENEFLAGPIHASVACHGYAKRNLQLASQFYRAQHDLHAVCVCVSTLYGPNDTFDLERTKVLGALIRRFCDAADYDMPYVECWGTGVALREFIYVEDAARDLLLASLAYDDSTMPLNVGSGTEISLKELSELVSRLVGYNGDIRWDASRPDGQLRKKLDNSRWLLLLEGVNLPYTPLTNGILKTAAWYREHRNEF